MMPRLPDPAPIRHEAHFDDRVMRCFRERPTDTWALFEKAVATHPQADALVADETRLSWPHAYVIDLLGAGDKSLARKLFRRIKELDPINGVGGLVATKEP